MSLTATESVESRDVSVTRDTSRFELKFLVTADEGDVVNENDVLDFLITGGVPITFGGLPREEVRVDERINAFSYLSTVTYQLTNEEESDLEPQAGQTESFDTTGGQVHLTFGLAVVSQGGEFSPKMGAAINYDGEKVQGVDITSPAYRYTFRVKKLDSEVTDAYQETLFDLTGTVNSSPVKWFLQRDLLFRGAIGSKTRENAKDASGNDIEDEWEITYHFDGRKTETNFDVGDFTVALKAGWDYVTLVFEDVDDSATKTIVRKVKSFAVLRLFEEADFNQLGINI